MSLSPQTLSAWWQATRKHTKLSAKRAGASKLDSQDLRWLEKVVRAYSDDILRLHDVFTSERQQLSRYLLDPKKEAAAYLLGFHLNNAIRTQSLLDRSDIFESVSSILSRDDSVEILDLGCGTGALSQVVADHWSDNFKVTVKLIDKHRGFLSIADTIHTSAPTSRRQTIRISSDIESFVWRKQEAQLRIVTLGYFWNELLRRPKAQRKVRNLIKTLSKEDSMIVFVDSANRNPARAGMLLRDDLVQSGFDVLYPCPKVSSCPLNLRSRDWCFSEFEATIPPELALIQRNVFQSDATKRTSMKFSTSAMIAVSETLAKKIAPQHNTQTEVVVGRPKIKRDSDSFRYLVCSDRGLKQVKPSHKTAAPMLRGSVLSKSEDFRG